MLRKVTMNTTEKLRLWMSREDGMETVETVVMIAACIAIAGGLILVMTGEDHQSGVIGNLLHSFEEAILNMIGMGSV